MVTPYFYNHSSTTAPTQLLTITKHFLYSFLVLETLLLQSAHAYPPVSVDMEGRLRRVYDSRIRPLSMSKRAFDRLDVSPFDFDALSKRFVSDPYYSSSPYYYEPTRMKRAFDRLDDNGFFGLSRKKRAFDRLDHSFFMGNKRSDMNSWNYEGESIPVVEFVEGNRQKRPFDRLDSAGWAFGLSKRSQNNPTTTGRSRISIGELLAKYPVSLGM